MIEKEGDKGYCKGKQGASLQKYVRVDAHLSMYICAHACLYAGVCACCVYVRVCC